MFIDSHFHLNMIEENIEIQKKVLEDSKNKGLITGINIYTSPDALIKDRSIINKLEKESIKVACGWYPEYSLSQEMIEKLENVIREYNIFAIGEIGLEYYRMHKPKLEQIELFEAQMEIAKKYNKPVIIHTREATEDTIRILKKFPSVKGIIHCFSGTKETAKTYLDIGYYISFAGNLTFKKSTDLQETIKFIPIDMIMFETDAPFLAPMPFRGQKNLPYMVKYTYEFASKILNLPIEDLSLKILQNWENFTKNH
ncbi:MAG: TatD family hydrolase [Brevinematia bacterium]